ncbi:MAG: hypothetical protein AMXMBFR82_51840 [Candidatus Hydrogenedentota bacterium]
MTDESVEEQENAAQNEFVEGSEPSSDWAAIAQVRTEPGWKDLATAVGIIWAIELGLSFLTLAVLFGVSGFNPAALEIRVQYLLPAMTFSWLGTLVVIWYFGSRKYCIPLREAFALRAVSWRKLAYCGAAGLGLAVVAGILMSFLSTGEGAIMDLVFDPPSEEGGQPTLSPYFALIAVALPALEELYYRGFLYGALKRLAGTSVAIVVVVVWFGIVHAPQLVGDWTGVIVVTIMGGIFTGLRQWFGSIFPSMVAHVSYNAVLVVAGLIGSSQS